MAATFRKTLCILAVLLIALSVFGCGKKEEPAAHPGGIELPELAPAMKEPTAPPAAAPETEPATEPETEPKTEPETEPATEPETEPVTEPATEPETEPATEAETEPVLTEEDIFFNTYFELDRESTEAWLKDNPDQLKDGYYHIRINESGLKQDGTDLSTVYGDQILALDTENGVILVRVWLENSRGVMAILKDPSRLHLYPSSKLGSRGETAGTIAQNHNGIVAMTASGFIDNGGGGNGGRVDSYCVCDGEVFGKHSSWGSDRIELHTDDRLYLAGTKEDCGPEVTDAVEFRPIMIRDGEIPPIDDYLLDNPRACIGQTDSGEVYLFVLEGRFSDSPGCGVDKIAVKMLEYGVTTAMNQDGGTSAIMWYDGEPVTRCSNKALPEGRTLPNAWVYCRAAAD